MAFTKKTYVDNETVITADNLNEIQDELLRVADIVPLPHEWNGTVLTITSESGTSSADLKGDKGDKGDTGAKGADGKTPVKGTDYYTAADISEMASLVKASLSTENWTFTLEDGSTVTKAVYVG